MEFSVCSKVNMVFMSTNLRVILVVEPIAGDVMLRRVEVHVFYQSLYVVSWLRLFLVTEACIFDCLRRKTFKKILKIT